MTNLRVPAIYLLQTPAGARVLVPLHVHPHDVIASHVLRIRYDDGFDWTAGDVAIGHSRG